MRRPPLLVALVLFAGMASAAELRRAFVSEPAIAFPTGIRTGPALAAGSSGYFVTWHDEREVTAGGAPHPRAYGARLTSVGAPIGDNIPLEIPHALGRAESIPLWNGSEFVAVSLTYSVSGQVVVVMTRVGESGPVSTRVVTPLHIAQFAPAGTAAGI